jgi:hypothetical protein
MSSGCSDRRGDIAAYIVGALDGDERLTTVTHLLLCEACLAEYNELAPVRRWLELGRASITCLGLHRGGPSG